MNNLCFRVDAVRLQVSKDGCGYLALEIDGQTTWSVPLVWDKYQSLKKYIEGFHAERVV